GRKSPSTSSLLGSRSPRRTDPARHVRRREPTRDSHSKQSLKRWCLKLRRPQATPTIAGFACVLPQSNDYERNSRIGTRVASAIQLVIGFFSRVTDHRPEE